MKFEAVQIHFLSDVFGLLSSKNFATMATWRDLPYIASISFYFIYARKIYVRMHVNITQPLEGK